MRHLRGEGEGVGGGMPESCSDVSVANTLTEKANLFFLLFSSNSTLHDSGIPPPTSSPSPLRCLMSLSLITHDRVHGILKSMNVRNASYPDGIPSGVLREGASELAPVLVQLYSLCLNTNNFPQCGKRSFVQPIPKKCSRSDPSNYRPIALTCVLSKTFETLLNSHFGSFGVSFSSLRSPVWLSTLEVNW